MKRQKWAKKQKEIEISPQEVEILQLYNKDVKTIMTNTFKKINENMGKFQLTTRNYF
jgi:hypothetical protein